MQQKPDSNCLSIINTNDTSNTKGGNIENKSKTKTETWFSNKNVNENNSTDRDLDIDNGKNTVTDTAREKSWSGANTKLLPAVLK